MNSTTDQLFQRVVVIGTSGSGKTYLAARLAAALGYPHIELDTLHWLPDWQERSLEDFRTRVTAAAAGETWVADGNYSKVRDILWRRATSLVWLNYSRAIASLLLRRCSVKSRLLPDR